MENFKFELKIVKDDENGDYVEDIIDIANGFKEFVDNICVYGNDDFWHDYDGGVVFNREGFFEYIAEKVMASLTDDEQQYFDQVWELVHIYYDDDMWAKIEEAEEDWFEKDKDDGF